MMINGHLFFRDIEWTYDQKQVISILERKSKYKRFIENFDGWIIFYKILSCSCKHINVCLNEYFVTSYFMQNL